MTDVNLYPSVMRLLKIGVTETQWYDELNSRELHTELRALLTERDGLAASDRESRTALLVLRTAVQELAVAVGVSHADYCNDASMVQAIAKRVTPPPVASYKGVTYRDGKWWYCGAHGKSVASLISSFPSTFSDDDWEPLLALKDAPPPVTVEGVVREWDRAPVGITRDEELADLCGRLRLAFPHLDAPRTITPADDDFGPNDGYARTVRRTTQREGERDAE